MAAEIPQRYGDLTMNASQVFLDEIIEIDRLPESGLVLRAEHGPSQLGLPLTISLLPNQEGDGCSIYRQGPDPEDDLEAANAFEPEPFLEFDDVEFDDVEGDGVEDDAE